MKKILLIFIFSLFGVMLMHAQRTVTGTVVSSIDNLGIPGVSVVVKASSPLIGTVTDLDGHYSIQVSETAILVFSYTGMATQEEVVAGRSSINVTLKSETTNLGTVVVIGYGTMSKEKLTGSVAVVGQEDLNKGLSVSPMQLISGKLAGVNVSPSTGRAGDGNRIRIRGGASLNASNDPLIVIDGLPISNDGIAGQTNPLASLNPNDIESMTILKDASATAIYGSRASNGVIIITTKKGSGKKMNIEFNTTNSIATVARRVEVLSGDEYRKLIENYDRYTSLTDKARFLGYLGYTENGVQKYANTDWQNEIFRPAFTSDNTLAISGKIPHLPYRVSVGYTTQDGLLKTDNIQRVTGAITLNPTFFKDYLTFNVNLKGSWTKSRFADGGTIGSALRMDPTKPVFAKDMDQFNGYWQWQKGDGSWNSMATSNPVAQLYSRHDIGTAGRAFGNIQADYKLHFFPDLKVNVNVGFDYSNGKGYNAYDTWNTGKITQGGEHSQYNQTNFDFLFEAYLAYTKDFGKNHFDIMAGYTYQSWLTTGPYFPTYAYDQLTMIGELPTFERYKDEHVLISFYGRANYSWADKYLLQASFRADASSRFPPENRWGFYPGISAAWRINKESFLAKSQVVSNLKLRLGWGITGQQEGIGNYEYLARYNQSTNTAMVQFGDQFYYMWRPEGYDPYHRWESTTTYNVGLDYGFLQGKIYGAIDLYYKWTKDLLNKIYLPLGSNFTNQIIKNIGSMANKGLEFSINYIPVDTKNWNVDLGLNVTITDTKIKKLILNDNDTSFPGSPTGEDISGGTGNKIQRNIVGYSPYSFYVYEQNYDANGKLIEGSYVDRSGDGKINEDDMYAYKSPEPVAFIGFNANITWKNLTLSTSLRSSLGNYLYNNIASDIANYSQVLNPNNFLSNTIDDIYSTNIYARQLISDYYIQNASFLKMDYLSLGYDFSEFIKVVKLSISFTVQNVFTLTKYTGIDPEIAGGMDKNIYPYPRTFSLGIKLQY